MKILLTGSSGFVGSSILRYLLRDRNLEIDSLGRRDIQPKEGLTTHHSIDLAFDSIHRFLNQHSYDILIHAAWNGLPKKDSTINFANFQASKMLFESFVDSGGKVIIGIGSCLEYGSILGPVNEAEKGKNVEDFGLTKRALSEVISKLGIPYLWLRPFYLYGEGQHPNSLLNLSLKYLSSENHSWLQDPLSAHDFVFIDDLGQIVYELIKKQMWIGELNVGTSFSTQNFQFVNAIRQRMGRSELRYLDMGVVGMSADSTKLRKYLPNFQFTSVSEGISHSLLDAINEKT